MIFASLFVLLYKIGSNFRFEFQIQMIPLIAASELSVWRGWKYKEKNFCWYLLRLLFPYLPLISFYQNFPLFNFISWMVLVRPGRQKLPALSMKLSILYVLTIAPSASFALYRKQFQILDVWLCECLFKPLIVLWAHSILYSSFLDKVFRTVFKALSKSPIY